jgi:hypothetical protein
MREREAAIFDLSPPDATHCAPPQIRKMRDKITARISKSVIEFPTTFTTVFSPPLGIDFGGVSTWLPGRVSARYAIVIAYKETKRKARGRLKIL